MTLKQAFKMWEMAPRNAVLAARSRDAVQKVLMRKWNDIELEHEFETKKLQLDLEVPKRFAQGEWVSGKTLTEIIKTLAGRKKED